MPIAGARFVAEEEIPHAPFVELAGTDRLIWFGDDGAVVDHVRRFITSR